MRALSFTQLHELPSHPALLAPSPQKGRGQRKGTVESRSSPAQHSKAQPSWLHLQTTSRRNEDLPHKEQVWNQPADSHPWQTQERKWQEVRTKAVFIICGGMSMGNYTGCGCEAPPFAVKANGNLSAPESRVAPTWTCLMTQLMPWQGTSQKK